jgi:hypothetical protein
MKRMYFPCSVYAYASTNPKFFDENSVNLFTNMDG